MATDRRRDAATATVGYGLVGTGGVLREMGIQRAHRAMARDKRMAFPGRSLIHAPKGPLRSRARRVGMAGYAVGLLGTPAAATGTYNLVRRREVDKADRTKEPFLRAGFVGSTAAIKDKATGVTESPPKAKLLPLGIGAAGAAGGSFAGHRVLDRVLKPGRGGKTRAAITAAAGVAGATGIIPGANAAMRATGSEYKLTPTGVRRRKAKPLRPSKSAHIVEARPGKASLSGHALRQQLVPSDHRFGKADGDYLGRRVSRPKQRSAVYAAGATPIAGPLVQAKTAASFAPPGQERKAATRQFVGGPLTGLAGGTAGSYGLAHLADKHKRVESAANRAADMHHQASDWVGNRPAVRELRSKLPKGSGRIGNLKATGGRAVSRALPVIGRNKVAAGVGFIGGKIVAGQTGGNIAISRNFSAQDRYNRRHPVGKTLRNALGEAHERTKINKSIATTGMTPRDERALLQRKKRKLRVDVATTALGASGLGLLAASRIKGLRPRAKSHLERAAIAQPVLAGGVASIGGVQGARIMHRDLEAQERKLNVRKAGDGVLVPIDKALSLRFPAGLRRRKTYRDSSIMLRRARTGIMVPTRRKATVA